MRARQTHKHTTPKPVTIHNSYNLPWTVEQIRTFTKYGGFRNLWRNRLVEVFQIPIDQMRPEYEARVVSIGTDFTTGDITICLEGIDIYNSRIVNSDWSDYR